MTENKKIRTLFKWWIREIVAIIFWCYIFLKLVIFDFDIYIIYHYFPFWRWIINYKFIVLITIIAVLWIFIGKKKFPKFVFYILAYPLIVLWRISKVLLGHFPLAIAFMPAAYEIILTFRKNFIYLTFSILSAVIILTTSNQYLLMLCMAFLCLFLLRHLYKSFKKAYQSSMFAGLAQLIKRLRLKIEGFFFDKIWTKVDIDHDRPETEKAFHDQLSTFYLFNCLYEFISEKLYDFAKSRKLDLYLIASWIFTVMLTILIFALEYMGLYKIEHNAFSNLSSPTFWSFFGFSFGKFAPSTISTILPASLKASFLCYAQNGCAVALFIILLFTILTAARERYHDDIEMFLEELRLAGDGITQKYLTIYSLALAEVEIILISKNQALVKSMRKLKGLSELLPPNNDQKN